MFIENPDAFKSWLTSILEPLCDADPAALAKYVYALVKKDKPLEDLRDGMVDQLDVFLQHETKPFVDMLFKALESQEHLKMAEKMPPPPAEQQPALQPVPEEESMEQPANGVAEGEPSPPGARDLRASPPPAVAAPRHRVVVSRAPAPPRGPHHEQTLVKVLPLTELLEEPVDPPRRKDRRGDGPPQRDDRHRRRGRPWERPMRARRHPPPEHERRRPSRSPSPRPRYRNRSPPAMVVERSPSRSRSRSPVPLRERDHERERERLRMPREMERDRMSRDRDHRDRLSRSRDRDRSRERSRGTPSPHPDRLDLGDAYKRRCRDFDEKGYCMRGDLCQWDHGADPVVLEDAALTRVLIPPQPPVPEYNPLAPDIWCGAGFPPYPHPMPPAHMPHPPRELIPIPRVRHELPPPGPPMMPVPCHPPPPRKHFDYNRLGPARPPLPQHAANCSLEVKKVPRGLNDITHLNNHFGKFGKIVNIQVCFEGDPEGALITFSSPTEANVAHKSTEAVLNNRFIKVFWHNPEAREKEAANGQAPEPKKEPPRPVEKSKQVMEMHKRAQALLETQLQQQVLLIQRLESGNEDEGVSRSLSRLQLAQSAKKPKTREEAQKEILDAELDMFTKQQEGQDVTELAKRIADLRRQMAAQFPSHLAARRPHARGGRFNTATRYTRGAAAAKTFGSNSVDHRPRALLVSGFEAEELDALVAHFSQFGEVAGKEANLAVPELVVQFKARAQAEQALLRGKNYNDRTLTITWVTNNKPVGGGAGHNGDVTESVKEPEAPSEPSEDSLLRFDEEEEDDTEDRSWRR